MLQSVVNRIPRRLLALLMSWLVLVLPLTIPVAQAMPVSMPSDPCITLTPMDAGESHRPATLCGADMSHWECADCDISSCQCPQLLARAVTLAFSSTSPERFPPWSALLTERIKSPLERPPRG